MRTVDSEQITLKLLLIILAGWLSLTILFPLMELLIRSFHDNSGQWIGLVNFVRFFETPSLNKTLTNTVVVSTITALIGVFGGALYAYALTRTTIPFKPFFKTIALAPLFAPSMMHAIAMIYLFGNKGIVTTGFFGIVPGIDIGLYGPVGIVLSELFFVFPKAVLIMMIAFSSADMRLYDSAKSFGAGPIRTFLTVTLPGIRFGLISSFFVAFTLAFTDFGAPKVVGGQWNMLAVDVYKKVIGQQDFSMGAALSIILVVPTLLAFILDQKSGKKSESLTSRSMPYRLEPKPFVDQFYLFFTTGVAIIIVGMLLTVATASLVKSWPYNLSLTLNHFDFSRLGSGTDMVLFNSILIAIATALIGSAVIFFTAWITERQTVLAPLRKAISFGSLFPTAIPGTVLGLAYIFFFNRPEFSIGSLSIINPFHGLYGTMAILVIANMVHYMPVSFLTAQTALKSIDRESELTAKTLGISQFHLLWRVIIPVSFPALIEMVSYLFVNSMTTVSALIFLYVPSNKPGSVAIMDMEDAGDIASASALAVLIVLVNIVARLICLAVSRFTIRWSQKWKGE